MQTLKSVDPAGATGKTKQIFDALQKQLGTIPNLMRTLANSSAALNAYMSFNTALGEGKLPTALREQLSIAVANVNSCDYCLSAHRALGKLAGLADNDVGWTRGGRRVAVRRGGGSKARVTWRFGGRDAASCRVHRRQNRGRSTSAP